MKRTFARFALVLAQWVGTWQAFLLCWVLFTLWIAAGFNVGFADMLYQFIGSNFMSYVSLLLLVLLQASQNHDTAALQLKIDELIRATDAARNSLAGIEDLPIEELARVKQEVSTG